MCAMYTLTRFNILSIGLLLANPLVSFAATPDLPNFSQVNANLYRGGDPTEPGLEHLKEIGVKTIINLQGGDLDSIYAPIVVFTEPGELASAIQNEEEAVTQLRMTYRSYPLDSLGPVNLSENTTVSQILKDIENPILQPVYVHCQHGKDRTGMIVAIERVEVEGWSKAKARQEWIADGHSLISRIFTGWLDLYFNSSEVGT